MTVAAEHLDAEQTSAAGALETLALACILAVLVGRTFAGEMPFRTSQLVLTAGPDRTVPHKPPDELLRVTFALVLLAAPAFWSVAQVIRRRTRPVGWVFGVMILIFAALAFASASRAMDVRGALTAAFEQAAILLAALVMMHLAAKRHRGGLVVVVLAALAGAMAVKALAEVTFEIPQRIADFDSDPAGRLAQVGIAPASPQAKMFEKRLRDPACFGYLGLSNVFASLMVVLAAGAAGLAIEKFAAARRSRRSARMGRGEIHLPTLAAVAAFVLPGAGAAVLILTRSKGGLAAGAFAAAAAAVVMSRPAFFERHRRKFLSACAAALVAGICAAAAWGMLRGSLPGRSMQVRWEYWIGAVRIVEDSPALGVGGGNFGPAYLRHRLPAAAEATKSPHNVLLGAATQFGLVGGGFYLAILVWIFLAATRPRGEPAEAGWHGHPQGMAVAEGFKREGGTGVPPVKKTFMAETRTGRLAMPRGPVPPVPKGVQMVGWCVFLPLVAMVVRAVWVGSTNPAVLFIEAAGPAIVFAACLLAAMWTGSALGGPYACGRYARIAVVAGLAGFALHNLVSYTLWMPATATVFWIAAGAMAGPAFAKASAGLPRLAGAMRIPVAVLAAAALVAAGLWLWRPVQVRTLRVRAAQEAWTRGDTLSADDHMREAIRADEFDGFAPADLARAYAARAARTTGFSQHQNMLLASEHADRAWRRSPTPANAKLLARRLACTSYYGRRSLELAAKAVELDPMNVRFRLEYAEMLCAWGPSKFDAAAGQIQEIRRIDRQRPLDSDLQLTPVELKRLDLLEEKVKHTRRRTGRKTAWAGDG